MYFRIRWKKRKRYRAGDKHKEIGYRAKQSQKYNY